MTRKKFIKNCMAVGICRNAANYLAKRRDPFATNMIGRALVRHQITNCQVVAGGAYFRVKLRGGGGNE